MPSFIEPAMLFWFFVWSDKDRRLKISQKTHKFIRLWLHQGPVSSSAVNSMFVNSNGSLCLMSHRLRSTVDFPSAHTIPLSRRINSGRLTHRFRNGVRLECCYFLSLPVVFFEYYLLCSYNFILVITLFVVRDISHPH